MAETKYSPELVAELHALGARMRGLRDAAHLTLNEFAERIGMNPKNYRRIEKGRTNCRVDSLLRIATGFGLTLDQLFAFKVARQRTPQAHGMLRVAEASEPEPKADPPHLPGRKRRSPRS